MAKRNTIGDEHGSVQDIFIDLLLIKQNIHKILHNGRKSIQRKSDGEGETWKNRKELSCFLYAMFYADAVACCY